MKSQNFGQSKVANVRYRFRLFLPALLTLLLMRPEAAQGLTIALTDVGDTPMTVEQFNAFERAAQRWEDRFWDPVTVNIDVAFESFDGTDWDGALGLASSARTTHSFSTVRAAMLAKAYRGAEEDAIDLLPLSSVDILDTNGDRAEDDVTMTTANAKALGLGTGTDTTYADLPDGVDARIRFNTEFDWDYDPNDGIRWNRHDFVGVAAHEIGHALGFISVTDVQDRNPDHTLHLSTLDLFRFSETGAAHDLETERREVTCGPAEYYDTVLNNVPFSHGVMCTGDPHCGGGTGHCQGSHWSDDQGHLMDPSVSQGTEVAIHASDAHALDYIGWNPPLMIPINPNRFYRVVLLGWFWLDELPDLPDFGGDFDPFPPPPPWKMIEVPKPVTLGLRAGFDLGMEGARRRSGLGYATFKPDKPVQPKIVRSVPPSKGQWEYLDPPGEPATNIPANLSEVFIQSDLVGVPFVFRSTCGENGCPFDPGMGDYGGYRVPGFIDGEGDQVTGDVDAQITMMLLASDKTGAPDPNSHNLFQSAHGHSDGNITVYDAMAIGVDCYPSCRDDYNEWVVAGKPNCWCYPRQCHGDADGMPSGSEKTGYYFVGVADLNTLISAWLVKEPPLGPGIDSVPDGICADFAHDQGGSAKTGYYRVGPTDLNILITNWLQKEPPSGRGVKPDCLDCP
ncbi:MAG: NF038122 family metalloprotease [Phycisphaerales bacterium]|nr:MAG: NF038122 family metalloprotease [Phycisphaerales bacterium]